MNRYDIIVAGLGAAGAATALMAAKRGARVLGLDRHAPPHALGSSHGETRITRLAIGEGAHFTPLALRSHAIWRALEQETGETLLTQNGGLILSSPGTAASVHVPGFFANTLAAAERFRIAHEMLDAAAIRRRFPQFRVRDEEAGYHEPEAGYLHPEACIRAELMQASRHGADIRVNEAIADFESRSDRVKATTANGSYTADMLVLAIGPWLPQMLNGALAAPFTVRRQAMFWFAPAPDAPSYAPDHCPVFIWELPDSDRGIYGFPAIAGPEGGVKIATEQYETATTPDEVERMISTDEIRAMFGSYVGPYFNGLTPDCVKAATCLYTVTPDANFVIDRHPQSERVILVSPCSGHGFKHSAAIGEAVADWALAGRSAIDLGPFRLSRFGEG